MERYHFVKVRSLQRIYSQHRFSSRCSIYGRECLQKMRAMVTAHVSKPVDKQNPFEAFWASLGHYKRRQVYIVSTGYASERAGLRWNDLDPVEQEKVMQFVRVDPGKSAASRRDLTQAKSPAATMNSGGSITLGTTTKSVHGGGGKRNPLTGYDPHKARRVRLGLLRTAQSVMFDREAPKQKRTVWCGRTVKSRVERVSVRRAVDGSNARLSGVAVCGCVWTCPVCAAKITEARRQQLAAGMVNWTKGGGYAYLLTLTFPHQVDMPLVELLAKQTKALHRFHNSRQYKAFSERYHRAGTVKSLEVTWGRHGWHPHSHSLIFADPGLEQDQATLDALKKVWTDSLRRYALADGTQQREIDAHSFDLRGGQYASEYIAKFGHETGYGLSAEITRAHAKIGARRGLGDTVNDDVHVTPFQILEWAAEGDRVAWSLFREYAECFEGKRMLVFSPGLKQTLKITDADDWELADEPLPDEIEVAQITAQQLAVIVSRNAVADFLEYVATCCDNLDTGQGDVDDWIAAIEGRPKTHSGTVRVRPSMATRYYERDAA